jgi:hypothetical protein
MGEAQNNLMEALKGKSSPFSDEVVKKFRHLQQEYAILSFYETRPMGRFGLVCYCPLLVNATFSRMVMTDILTNA